MSQTIAVIDYGMGNLRSVAKAVEHVCGKANVVVTNERNAIRNADRIVFPGQGAAAECMSALEQHDLIDELIQSSKTKPFLGICMGMQVLLSNSHENQGVNCLSLMQGEVKPFSATINTHELKVPHMGWNKVFQMEQENAVHPLWKSIDDGSRFYFVHSYYAELQDGQCEQGRSHYGIEFTSAIGKDNIFAIQCHPEKSAASGLQLLKNFVEWSI